MKKIFLILFFFSIGFSATAHAGKNLNWCESKIKYPFYIDGGGHEASVTLLGKQGKDIVKAALQ